MSVDSLAAERATATGRPADDWRRAIESARQSLRAVDDATLFALARASATPERFTTVARLIYARARVNPGGDAIARALLESANASSFSLGEWIDAIDFFHDWLARRGRKIDLLPMVKYLECCTAAPDGKDGRQTLERLAKDMLDTFGYEAG